MVLSLEPDATLAPNPTSGKPATREGPSAETTPNSSLRPAKVLFRGGGGSASGSTAAPRKVPAFHRHPDISGHTLIDYLRRKPTLLRAWL
jgi:hypothetical protein